MKLPQTYTHFKWSQTSAENTSKQQKQLLLRNLNVLSYTHGRYLLTAVLPCGNNSKNFHDQQKVVALTVRNSGVTTVYLTFRASALIQNVFTVRDCHGNIIETVKKHRLRPGTKKTHTIMQPICKRVGAVFIGCWILIPVDKFAVSS